MITKIIDILQLAQTNGVNIELDKDQLQLKFVKGITIDPLLLAQIKSNKQQIINFLKDTQTGLSKDATNTFSLSSIIRDPSVLIPLSFSQERLWFIDKLEGSKQYHMPAVLRIKGQLNGEALMYALKEIINRHEVLRTVFKENQGQVFQHIQSADKWKLNFVDGAVYHEDPNELKEFVQELITQPFNLSKDFMLRADLISLLTDEYVLVVTMHHIASDGWSKSVLVKEVLDLYKSFSAANELAIKPLPVQYADYAIWQRQYLVGDVLEIKLNYWKQKLADVNTLQLHTDYTRPAIQSFRGASLSFNIDKSLSTLIKEFSVQNGATLFMTLLTVYKILLYRYSGQNDICVGSPVAGRKHPELEDLIGFFTNTLVLRTTLNQNFNFIDLLQQVRRVTIEAQENQDIPFEKVVDAIVKERSLSRNPIAQVMFSLQNTPEIPSIILGDLNFLREGYEHTTSPFDITFFINETSNGLTGIAEYATDLYNVQTIRQMVAHFKQLLVSVLQFPAQKISELPMLSVNETDQLLVQFNGLPISYPAEKSIVDLFKEQVANTPDDIALEFEEKQITYQELNVLSDKLAAHLINKGIKEDILVPVCIERGIEMIIAILGILKAGGAYVPIDPAYPIERINFIIKDTKATILISNAYTQLKLPPINGVEIIALSSDWFTHIMHSSSNEFTNIKPSQLAYIIYTSGSTGNPKGVMIEHCSVISLIKTQTAYFNISSEERIVLFSNYSFDASIEQIFLALFNGASLIIFPEGLQYNTDHFQEFLSEKQITHLHTTPFFLENLRPAKYGCLKRVIAGGDTCNKELAILWSKDVDFYNEYGPTETTVTSVEYGLNINDLIKINSLPIGKPLANVTAYILDNNGQLCAIGVAGELYIGGVQVARGYLNLPELTADKFLADPFSKNNLGKMYRTGDLCRWMENGNIEFSGRVDDQVKISGYRIELGEIETALNDLKQVDLNCVIVKQEANAVKRLVCYYIPNYDIIKAIEKQLYLSQLDSWKDLYNSEYIVSEDDENVDREFDIAGWNDSFTKAPIPAEQMKDWLQDIIQVIMAEDPGHVLEIGCGTGLIYFQLAGKIKKYIGTDFSRPALDQINQIISKGRKDYGATELLVSAAHEIIIPQDEVINTIILNSIVQYFPGDEYMTDVIRKSIQLLKSNGRIVIGDVRDNRLLKSFKQRLQLDKMQQSASVREFNWAVSQDLLNEEELCFSPEYFYNLQSIFKEITHINIQWKDSEFVNELTLYRYTVVIYVGIQQPIIEPVWQSWNQQSVKENLLLQMDEELPLIAIKNCPNKSLWKEQQLLNVVEINARGNVGELLSAIEKVANDNQELTDFLLLAKAKGYQYKLLIHEDLFLVNVLLERNTANCFVVQPYKLQLNNNNRGYTNIPLYTDINLVLQKEIRLLLQQQLPEYMLPAELIAIDKLPLNSNGKIDRKFLSERKDKRANKLNYQAPRTEQETKLCIIWQQLLRIEKVGIDDNFFELGGHSLLVTRLISAIRNELGFELPIKDIFLYPTIADLSIHINAMQGKTLVLPPIEVIQKSDRIPLSFSQERLWFVDRLEGSIAFHVPAVLKLSGTLDKNALSLALQTVVKRHQALRTIFDEDDGKPYQSVKDSAEWILNIEDDIIDTADEKIIQQRISKLIAVPFNLTVDFTLRADLLVLSQTEFLLVITLHHIASDAWSLGILINEVVEIYKSVIEERPVQLSKLPVQYLDYAIWQKKYLTGDLLSQKINYWKTKLHGIEPLKLPTDFTRPPLQSTMGATVSFKIDKNLTAKIKSLSTQEGSTLFMTLLAVFNVLLQRYTAQNDICVGTSIAGRQQQEVENLIGFFVNILALRTVVDNENSFSELLQQVKKTTLDAYQNQEVPFEKIVDAVIKERDISRSPLLQVLLVVLNTPEIPAIDLGELKLSAINYQSTKSKYDLTFFIKETPTGLSGIVEYSTALFTATTINRMVNHFTLLLSSIVAAPNKKISTLQMLSNVEQQQLLYDFNINTIAYPAHQSIVDLFNYQVQLNPTAIALIFNDEVINYSELDKRSNQLANYLLDNGIQPSTNIGLISYRGIDMIVAMFGILKCGCAYVPFNVDYPQERISYMVEDAGIVSVIHTDIELIKQAGIAHLECYAVSDSVNYSIQPPSIKTNCNACIYVMFTSGTTGRPKGIAVSQKNILKLVYDDGPIAVHSDDRVLQWSNYSFDGSTYDIYSSLLKGATLVIIREDQAANFDELSGIISNKKITIGFITTALFNTFIDIGADIFKGMRKILFGGEMVSISHVKQALLLLGQNKIVHVYGPTETTVYASSYAINEIDAGTGIPIGKPLCNTKMYVLNNDKSLVPIGVPGELYIGGDGVSMGYVNNELLNKEKFIPNHFDIKDANQLYSTGDIVRWLPEGVIEYIGRTDDQVKVRGFRIELSEIETVLQQCDLVKNVVVLAVTDKEGTKRLVAYIVTNGAFNKEVIHNYLRNKLPDFMVPAILVEIDQLPLNANGKIDKKALPDSDLIDLATNNFVTPQTTFQIVLADIWKNLLGVEGIGIHDNFFETGGDSLLAIRVVAAVRKQLNVEMPISYMFEYQTICKLAEQLTLVSGTPVLPPILVAIRPERIPLSFSQERLWFIDKLEGGLQYHIPGVIRLKGVLNITALQSALHAIINRHEVLRTVFLEEDGQPFQLIKSVTNWELPQIDFSNNENKSTQQLNQFIQQLINIPFDLAKDNMLRAHLIILNNDEWILVISFHHIASDGWSKSIFINELSIFYNAFDENKAFELSPLKIQYADYAIWQRGYLQGEVLTNKLKYWQNKLKDVEPLQLPLDFVRPVLQTTRGAKAVFNFDNQTLYALQQISLQQSATLFMSLLAVLKVLCYRYTNQNDVCIGTGIAGRQQQEVEGLIGFFINTLALRTQFENEDTFITLLKKVRQSTIEAYQNQEVPFEKVVDAIVKKRDRSRNPIFQVMFVLQNTPDIPVVELSKLQLQPEAYEHTTSQFDLSFSITETVNGLAGSLEYNVDLFTEQTINRMLLHFQQLVSSIIQDPNKQISKLKFISSEEEKQILSFNSTSSNYPANKSIIDILETQVVLSPDATAIIFRHTQLTYRELNEKANQLANHLKLIGCTPGSMVAVSFERSLNTMIAILGVLKAGAAYVPIEVDYPEERIQFILNDINASIIITDQTKKSITNINLTIVNLDADCNKINSCSTSNLSNVATPESLAYIMYTSGSTGAPKGVMVTHANVVSLVKGADYVNLSSQSVLLSTGAFSFDATTFEYWGMLLNGGQLVLCNAETLRNSQLLKREIDNSKVNLMWFTSSWFNQLVETKIDIFEQLKTVLVGGEKLSENHIQKLRQTYPHVQIINGYGPTENTTFSLTYHFTSTSINNTIPIGRSINNRTAFILDEQRNLLPVGIAGEIYLGGAGVSNGYLNQPELTNRHFISNPFSITNNEKLYKTGDTGCWQFDGNIQYLGRVDEQVKIRGYRIDLGEIEIVLQQSLFVKQAVVIASSNSVGDKVLVAYIIPTEDYDKGNCILYLQAKLPDYMIPAIWIKMDILPLTINGKIDKKALPKPEEAYIGGKQFEELTTKIEIALVAMWKQILNVTQLGIHDNFFEMGGHSLLAMRLISAVSKALQLNLSVKDLFMYPTVSGLARFLKGQHHQPILPKIESYSRSEHIPLSFNQERLWLVDQLHGSVSYNSPTVIRLSGKLNQKALIYALQMVVNRHEVLRTVFYEINGIPYQTIKNQNKWQLNFVDGAAYKDDADALQTAIQHLIAVPFNLAKDDMLRGHLITLEDDNYILVATMHHIASDGWSVPIITKEVVEFYNCFVENSVSTLPELPFQYADYAIWQRKYINELFNNKIDYWKNKLNNLTVLELPGDFKRPVSRTLRGAAYNFVVDKQLTLQLNLLSQQQGATLFMTLIATYNVLLNRYSGQQDICIGTSIAHRPQQELESMIGFFVNTVALRTIVNETSTFKDLLNDVKVTTLDAYSNQEVPFERVVEEVVKERDVSITPIFQVMMVLLNLPVSTTIQLNNLELTNEFFEIQISKFDITFHISESINGLSISIVYNTDLFREDTIVRMSNHFTQLLISVVSDPHQCIESLQMLTAFEEQQLLLEFN